MENDCIHIIGCFGELNEIIHINHLAPWLAGRRLKKEAMTVLLVLMFCNLLLSLNSSWPHFHLNCVYLPGAAVALQWRAHKASRRNFVNSWSRSVISGRALWRPKVPSRDLKEKRGGHGGTLGLQHFSPKIEPLIC